MKHGERPFDAASGLIQVLCLVIFFGLAPESDGVMTFAFEERNGDVVATVSGSVSVQGMQTSGDTSNGSEFQFGAPNCLTVVKPGINRAFQQGFTSNSGLTVPPTSSTFVHSFGYCSFLLYLPQGTEIDGTFVAPETNNTFFWTATTLSAIGLGGLGETPLKVWENRNDGDTMQFVLVPEPGALIFAVTGLFTFLCRRTRR
ncbi:MAG: hypothetical protein AAGB14_00390 [Verrucomicrobiota bacterium]